MSQARTLGALPWIDALLLIGVRLLVSTVVWWSGFRAVSDDDYARVVIAQRFAGAPAVDPSGTSWLPFPFWVQGSAMALFGAELPTAVAVAWTSGVASTILIWFAARTLGLERGTALIAAILASAIAYSAWLGVATVPELLTAGLVVYGSATLAVPARAREPRGCALAQRGCGALALCCATLSRYETWPVAGVFAVCCLREALFFRRRGRREHELDGRREHELDGRREHELDGRREHEPLGRRERTALAASAVVASAGMLLWLLHGVVKHGDATFFVQRVASYQKALGGHDFDALAALLRHPGFVVERAPALIGVALLGSALVWFGRARFKPTEFKPTEFKLTEFERVWARPLLACGGLLLFLIVGDLRGAGATHHPARTLLPVWFMACIVVAATWGGVWSRWLGRQGAVGAQKPSWRGYGGLLLVAACIIIVDGLQNRALDGPQGFVDRSDELAVGRDARRLLLDRSAGTSPARTSPAGTSSAGTSPARTSPVDAPSERVLIATEDYGYFAMVAAVADPSRVAIFDDHDPRRSQRNLFARPLALQQRIESDRITALVLPQARLASPAGATLLAKGPALPFRLQRVRTTSKHYALFGVERFGVQP